MALKYGKQVDADLQEGNESFFGTEEVSRKRGALISISLKNTKKKTQQGKTWEVFSKKLLKLHIEWKV